MTPEGARPEPESATAEPEGAAREPSGIVLDGASVRYPGRREPALAEVSLAVRPGEIVGVAGRTGAGKSTVALLAAGFIPRVVRAAVAGSASVDGIAATGLEAAPLAGRVGIVFSTPANQLSASKLTVREELAFGLENLGVPREAMDARIDAVLAELGIEHLADREPFALSGGEQQRVAIASIVAMGTDTLVLDEPTAQLDPVGTRQVADLLQASATAGRAVLCVEHDPAVLGRTDRTLVLEAGRMVGIAPPGVALGEGMLGSVGMPVPTIVRLAELAGVDPERAFDEAAVGAGLQALAADGAAFGVQPPDAAGFGAQPADTAAFGAQRADAATLRTPAAHAGPAAGEGEAPPALEWTPLRERPGVSLEVRGVTHRYPAGVEALRGVDLAIAPGETVAIVGQNGSGKTTLAKHLDGLLRPAAGSVLVDGKDIAGLAVHDVARTVGFVFQNPDDQLFNRSVEREVAFGPRNLGLAGSEAQVLVERALALAALTEVRTTNPYDLGLSTRKLVALASVLAMEPAVLVLDEPTTGQDGPGVARIGAIVDAFARTGRTVVAITHDMEFAALHFARIVVLREGTVVADGPPEAVFDPARAALLATTGLEQPVAARLGARLGIGSTPTTDALLAALGLSGHGPRAAPSGRSAGPSGRPDAAR